MTGGGGLPSHGREVKAQRAGGSEETTWSEENQLFQLFSPGRFPAIKGIEQTLHVLRPSGIHPCSFSNSTLIFPVETLPYSQSTPLSVSMWTSTLSLSQSALLSHRDWYRLEHVKDLGSKRPLLKTVSEPLAK